MTTVQTMLSRRPRCARRVRAARPPQMFRTSVFFVLGAVAALAGVVLGGCGSRKRDLVPPQVLVSPYSAAGGDVLWGVAPLANESGASIADVGAVSDALVARITEVRGLSTVPLNRTIAAMRAVGVAAIRSVQDARLVADALGVDALVVGTITAYDPYDPPKLGMTLALYSQPGALGSGGADWVDPKSLQGSYADDRGLVQTQFEDRPLAVVSEHLDGANHEVQMNLKVYAEGRHDPESALGWRRYLASMELYTEFAAFRAVQRLLDEERLRLAASVAAEEQAPR